ncbi:MAG: hypothetical protein WC838_07090 [Candidatus Margulisiibacteriota bacterium]|jgi:hypothetical protein
MLIPNQDKPVADQNRTMTAGAKAPAVERLQEPSLVGKLPKLEQLFASVMAAIKSMDGISEGIRASVTESRKNQEIDHSNIIVAKNETEQRAEKTKMEILLDTFKTDLKKDHLPILSTENQQRIKGLIEDTKKSKIPDLFNKLDKQTLLLICQQANIKIKDKDDKKQMIQDLIEVATKYFEGLAETSIKSLISRSQVGFDQGNNVLSSMLQGTDKGKNKNVAGFTVMSNLKAPELNKYDDLIRRAVLHS